ncbi:MAG: hypothetical protein WEF53_01665 [Bacteroidota bacterium]
MNDIFALLCEEVRDETQGSKTIIGVFPPNGVKLKRIPTILPKFAVFVSSKVPDHKEVTISVTILDPEGKELVKVKSPRINPKPPLRYVYFALNVSPLQIKQEGTYVVNIERDDGVSFKTNLDFKVESGGVSPKQ